MSILRLSTVALTLVLFTMGALILPVNTALAHCKGKHLTDPGPPDCFDSHGDGDPELPPTFSVDVDLVGVGSVDADNLTVTEVKIKGNRQGLNGTMAEPALILLPTFDLGLPCTIMWNNPDLAQFAISTAKIPPREPELTFVAANIFDFTVDTFDDARFTLSFVPNVPLSPEAGALFPTESNMSNVLTGNMIGVSISPDNGACSGTITQSWTITVTKN